MFNGKSTRNIYRYICIYHVFIMELNRSIYNIHVQFNRPTNSEVDQSKFCFDILVPLNTQNF